MFELADEIGREHVRALRALECATSVNEHTSTDSNPTLSVFSALLVT